MHNVANLFKDSDPKVKALYDALLDIVDEDRFKHMSIAAILGTLESLKISIALEVR